LEYEVEALLIQQEIEVFLPKVRSSTPRRKQQDAPFFPRYLFIRVDLERVALSSIQWLPGVHRIVTFGECPAVVPEDVIVAIKEQLNEIDAAGGLAVWRLRQGERVRITSGPFRDVEGLFDGTVRAGERVRLLLRLLGRICRVEVGIEDVEPVRIKIPRRTRGKGRWIRGRDCP
jgi:transcriptional antiterminator RfaH